VHGDHIARYPLGLENERTLELITQSVQVVPVSLEASLGRKNPAQLRCIGFSNDNGTIPHRRLL
jgi:hypothetical protein